VAAAGVALLEIGDEQGPALRAAAAERLPGWAVRLEPDLAGTPRVAVIEAPGGAAGVRGASPAAATTPADPTTATPAPLR
jgi:hypothetical protein